MDDLLPRERMCVSREPNRTRGSPRLSLFFNYSQARSGTDLEGKGPQICAPAAAAAAVPMGSPRAPALPEGLQQAPQLAFVESLRSQASAICEQFPEEV